MQEKMRQTEGINPGDPEGVMCERRAMEPSRGSQTWDRAGVWGTLAPETRSARLRLPLRGFLPWVPNKTTSSPNSVCCAVRGRRNPDHHRGLVPTR